MTSQQCLQILRTVKDVAFASVDAQGDPQVHIIDVMLIEEERLYFCTARGKDFYQQLIAHPHIAIVGMNKDFQMVRLSGEARHLDDQKYWIDRIFAENPSMCDIYPGDSRYILEAFCINTGELSFFDLGRSPIEREQLPLGDGTPSLNGFVILESCIGCGTCMRICPQQAIRKGTPYVIQDAHCLHCGLCRERCPMQAIKKRGEER